MKALVQHGLDRHLPVPPEKRFPAATTIGAFGDLWTDKKAYRPLDEVKLLIRGRRDGFAPPGGDRLCTVRVCDPDQRIYFQAHVKLTPGRGGAPGTGSVSFLTGGKLGTQYVYLFWPGELDKAGRWRHSRYTNFWLDAQTCIQTGDRRLDGLYAVTRDAMRQGRREYDTPRGKMVGYISADTWHFDGIWLRDWIYQLPAYRYWEPEMTCGLDRFLEAQGGDGMAPDGIERDGRTWRVGLESDVEYILTLGVWQTWQTTGDDAWLARALPKVEKALHYVCTDGRHWDRRHRLVKRQHSCDTWDFDIDGADDAGRGRHVIATCDASGYFLAFEAMAAMWGYLGRVAGMGVSSVRRGTVSAPFDGPEHAHCAAMARKWAQRARDYRRRAAALLWNGQFFLHHAHLDEIAHAGFDESQQLAMGNTWAMTRGMADPRQSRSIIDEYRRRGQATGDAYPWWSLQPGYPDELGYFSLRAFCRQGGYANGGLMPWVGGELCRSAFRFGRARYGVELLRQYCDHLARTGGAHVWYWPDGTPGFRTTNEVPYAGWGMAQWLEALIEGLAGLRDARVRMSGMEVSPRWLAAGIGRAGATVRYAANDSYFAYRYVMDGRRKLAAITFTGSGSRVDFRVLLPARPKRVRLEGRAVKFKMLRQDKELYCRFAASIAGVKTVKIE